jgi:acyl dehydratase
MTEKSLITEEMRAAIGKPLDSGEPFPVEKGSIRNLAEAMNYLNPLYQVKEPLTTRSVVKWAAAVKDFYEIHYDKDFARQMGMPDIIAHGPNKCALLSRLMLEWIGEQGRLHKLFCAHKASNFPGETLICKGKVKNKYNKDGKNYVEC